jgi:plasmid stabilization system protein ParE
MQVVWSDHALQDLERLREFIANVNPEAAAQVLQSHSRMGPALARYEPREVRRLIVGNYEMHYELRVNALYILRVWHTRENR